MSALAPHVLLLVAGIGVLYLGAEWLVRGAARLAGSLGVSPIVVGLTVVSFGTSAPELVVCVVAALGGSSDLAIGNVVGSNMANIGLILGLTALIRPLDVAARVVRREVPLMLLATLALFPLVWDHRLSRLDGAFLLVALAGYLVFVFQSVETETPEVADEYRHYMDETAAPARQKVRWADIGLVVAGSAGLVAGGYAIVEGAVTIASFLGIPELVIGLTVVAVGTSLPELATSLVAAVRREPDIAVGNVIGSNIFNLVAILGVSSVVEPMRIGPSVLVRELPALLLLSLLVLPMLRTGFAVHRWEGAVLLGSYLALGVWLL